MEFRTIALFQTRPFQPFLRGAGDLLCEAKPYYDQIKDQKVVDEKKGVVEPIPRETWQKEKSFSIGAFLLKYAGLEAFLNCAYHEFRVRELKDLPNDCFGGAPETVRIDLQKKGFVKCSTLNRVYFLASLCSEPMKPSYQVFDVASTNWKLFDELIRIRHSFVHAKSEQIRLELKRQSPGIVYATDNHEDNFWPLTGAPRDHRILNYDVAQNLCGIIDWVLERIAVGMEGKLDSKYFSDESAKLSYE